MQTNWLVMFMVTLLIMLYFQYYFKYNDGYKILQASLDNVDINMLYERMPLVITDRIVHPMSLTKTLFKWSYAFKSIVTIQGTYKPIQSHHKYTLLCNPLEDMTVNIINPTYRNILKPFDRKIMPAHMVCSKLDIQDSNVQYVTIKLKKQQCLLLPIHWIYQTDYTHSAIILDDPISIIVCLISIYFINLR